MVCLTMVRHRLEEVSSDGHTSEVPQDISVVICITYNVRLLHTFSTYHAFRFIFKACPLWKKSTQKLFRMERELYIRKEDTVLLKI